MVDRPGKQLGNYRLIRFLGHGGFAAFEQASRSQAPTIIASSLDPFSLSSPLPPTIGAKSASESQESLTPYLQPTQLATPPSSSIRERSQTQGIYSVEVRRVPQSKKAPNFGLLIGISILLVLVIGGGSFYLFFKGGSGNPAFSNGNRSGNNGSGTKTSTGGGVLKVALVTDVGGLNDSGFNQLAYTGYEKARTQYGFPDVVIQTQTPTASEYLKNLTSAANRADMVIAVGFLMETPLDQVAKSFTTKKFAIVDGCVVPDPNAGACENLPNVAPLFFKEQEAGCLVGAIAGQMEVDGKTAVPHLLGKNTIGAVGGLPVPPVNRYIAGYKYCATKVDPSVKVAIGYSSNFSDPVVCKNIANKQITDNMADIIFQVAGGCGIGVFDAAKAKNVYSIGVDVDQSKDSIGTVRQGVITSALKRVDTSVFTIINDAEKGTFDAFVANPSKFDLAHNGVGYGTTSSDVPADAVTTANNYANLIKNGTLVPPESIP